MNDASRVLLEGHAFHQPVGTVFLVQVEYSPDKYGTGNNSEKDAGQIIHACQIENDYGDENPQQSPGKDEEVLCGKPFELDLFSHSLINSEFGHR